MTNKKTEIPRKASHSSESNTHAGCEMYVHTTLVGSWKAEPSVHVIRRGKAAGTPDLEKISGELNVYKSWKSFSKCGFFNNGPGAMWIYILKLSSVYTIIEKNHRIISVFQVCKKLPIHFKLAEWRERGEWLPRDWGNKFSKLTAPFQLSERKLAAAFAP